MFDNLNFVVQKYELAEFDYSDFENVMMQGSAISEKLHSLADEAHLFIIIGAAIANH